MSVPVVPVAASAPVPAAAPAPAPPRKAVQLVLVTNPGEDVCFAKKDQEKDP